MGLIEKILRRPVNVSGDPFKTMTAYSPRFTSWNGALYESELVRSAVDARARHISKLQITVEGSARAKLRNRLRLAPNSWMTWSQFLYRTSASLDMQNNAFIVPVLDEYGEPMGVFPVRPSSCELVEHMERCGCATVSKTGKLLPSRSASAR